MIIDLGALAARRAAEQLSEPGGRAWRRRDPDEPARISGRRCVVCEEPFRGTNGARLCRPCAARGWTAARCECGAVLHRRDQTAHGRMRGFCGSCRAEMRARAGVSTLGGLDP